MRSALFVSIAILLALGVLFARERLKLAFRVGAALYAVLLVARFIMFGRTDSDSLLDLLTVMAIFCLIWLAAWVATNAILRARARRAASGRTHHEK